jgi:hypothetical protein
VLSVAVPCADLADTHSTSSATSARASLSGNVIVGMPQIGQASPWGPVKKTSVSARTNKPPVRLIVRAEKNRITNPSLANVVLILLRQKQRQKNSSLQSFRVFSFASFVVPLF